MKKIKQLGVKKLKSKKKVLLIANGANAFWVHQGPVLRSLVDLAKFLEIITVEQFNYHVRPNAAGGNDFSHWVAEVLQDQTCATALARTKTSTAARRVVKRSLARYDA